MRKLLPHIALITIALVGAGIFFAPQVAHAAWYDFLNPINVGYAILGRIFAALGYIAGWALFVVGQGIDMATNLSLAPDFFNSPAIGTSWSIIRDLCNMLFIFVLIWAGLRTILNIGNAVAVRKTITGVIIAALFINFSLFITKAIIDVSNVGTAWFVQGVENIGGEQSISGSVRAVLQMDKLVKSTSLGQGLDATLQAFVASFAFLVITLVAIYVFFQVAFFLIARIVAFIFLLITSPLGFVGWLEIPQLTQYSKEWWEEMRNQALMAPMFFLMLYITLYLVDQINTLVFSTNSATTSDPVTASSFSPVNYVMFAIIIMMLLKCLKTAKEYSGELGGAIAGYLKSATTFAGGAMLMGTIGKAANTVRNNKGFQAWSARNGLVGEYTMRGVAGTAGAKFGVSSGFKGMGLDKLGVPGTKDAFKGADKGYAGAIKAEADEYKKFAKDNLGKGAAGATNRRVFAEGLKGGLYEKVFKSGGATAFTGAGVGASIGTMAGPVGTVVGALAGAVAGGVAGKKVLTSEPAEAVAKKISAAAGRVGADIRKVPGGSGFVDVVGGAFEDKGKTTASTDMVKDAKKEYAKEAGKIVKEEKEAAIDGDLGLKQLEEEQKEVNREVAERKDRFSELVKQKASERDSLKKDEDRLVQMLKGFDVNKKTIDGLAVGDQVFDRGYQKAQNDLSSVRNQIEKSENDMRADPSQEAALKIRQWTAGKKIQMRKDELAKKLLQKVAAEKGVEVNPEEMNWDGMMKFIKKGDKVSGEETAAKIAKIEETIDKPAPEAKPDEGTK